MSIFAQRHKGTKEEILEALENKTELLKGNPDLRLWLKGFYSELADVLNDLQRPAPLGASPHEKSLSRHRNRANKYEGLYGQAKKEIALMQIKINELENPKKKA